MAHDMPSQPDLRNYLLNEIFVALGFTAQSWPRKLLWPFFWPPANLFARLAAGSDQDVAQLGPILTSRRVLSRFVKKVQVLGKEFIPAQGPVIIASNHPGAYDIFSVVTQLPRSDIKIVSSKIPLLQALPNLNALIIFTGLETPGRMAALRSIIRHLQEGGAVLIFPSGVVDPDPDVLPGAAQSLGDWSPSLEIALRRVPETRIVPTIVSGVLSPRGLRSPILRLQQEEWRQRKLAEFLQVIQQALFKRDYGLTPRVTFGQPQSAAELISRYEGQDVMSAIVAQARQVLKQHMAWAPQSVLPDKTE
jgi:hypothetical protein